ncbi:hypothetical protein TEA_010182 [Camellia sinensis var. sinensis]|uniref:Transposase MuDR plant domain-containing protein n=1 Tax=Camellia sinensis var. sinensis TaxID=542762 RepID=A0A4S4D2D0_CAMSN|nr:hypothetical protein TEA_010182 [Camellia sinensis var. sinensis]
MCLLDWRAKSKECVLLIIPCLRAIMGGLIQENLQGFEVTVCWFSRGQCDGVAYLAVQTLGPPLVCRDVGCVFCFGMGVVVVLCFDNMCITLVCRLAVYCIVEMIALTCFSHNRNDADKENMVSLARLSGCNASTSSFSYEASNIQTTFTSHFMRYGSVSCDTNRLSDVSNIYDEQDMLAKFCSHVEKVFLSAPWVNGIRYVRKSFEGGAAEFRTILRKYVVECGFRFKNVKNDSVQITTICMMQESRGCMSGSSDIKSNEEDSVGNYDIDSDPSEEVESPVEDYEPESDLEEIVPIEDYESEPEPEEIAPMYNPLEIIVIKSDTKEESVEGNTDKSTGDIGVVFEN